MRPHFVIVHRWRDDYAHYERYLDHRAANVTYVVAPPARASVSSLAAGIEVVERTDDLIQLAGAAGRLRKRFGPPERIVALDEGDLDAVAELRVLLGCPGETPQSQLLLRDKHAMVSAVAAVGVDTPEFAPVSRVSDVRDFLAARGGPVVVKPRFGTAGRAVVRIDGDYDLLKLSELPEEPRLVQSFCPDPVYHLDGIWNGADLVSWRASRYLATWAEYTGGSPLGSVEVDDPALLAPLREFTGTVLAALASRPAVLHLEAFVRTRPDQPPAIAFLEIGSKVGGAEIGLLWREVHGIDLAAAATAIQLNRPLPEQAGADADAVAGWLLVPTPVPAPCRVEAVEFDPVAPGPYAVVVPPVGSRVPRVSGYEHVGARMRFRGSSTAEVEQAIRAAAAGFRLYCSPA